MPIDLATLKSDAENNVKNFLVNRGTTDIPAGIQNTRDVIGNMRTRYSGDLAGALGSVPNMMPGTNIIAANASDKTLQGQNNKNELGFALRNLTEQRSKIQAAHAYLVDRLTNAGIDRQTAEQFARSTYLKDKQNEFTASENEKDRAAKRMEQGTNDAYTLQILDQEKKARRDAQQNALRNTVIRSLFGLGGTAVGYGLGGPLGGFIGGKVGSGAANAVGNNDYSANTGEANV